MGAGPTAPSAAGEPTGEPVYLLLLVQRQQGVIEGTRGWAFRRKRQAGLSELEDSLGYTDRLKISNETGFAGLLISG